MMRLQLAQDVCQQHRRQTRFDQAVHGVGVGFALEGSRIGREFRRQRQADEYFPNRADVSGQHGNQNQPGGGAEDILFDMPQPGVAEFVEVDSEQLLVVFRQFHEFVGKGNHGGAEGDRVGAETPGFPEHNRLDFAVGLEIPLQFPLARGRDARRFQKEIQLRHQRLRNLRADFLGHSQGQPPGECGHAPQGNGRQHGHHERGRGDDRGHMPLHAAGQARPQRQRLPQPLDTVPIVGDEAFAPAEGDARWSARQRTQGLDFVAVHPNHLAFVGDHGDRRGRPAQSRGAAPAEAALEPYAAQFVQRPSPRSKASPNSSPWAEA